VEFEMRKKLLNSHVDLKDCIRNTLFEEFGIRFNDNFDSTDILKHVNKFNNSSELEVELNKLATYIYEGKRRICFHEFRQFPYIQHGDVNSDDCAGLAKNYTSSDVYLIRFIRKFLTKEKGIYSFFDVDFIIKNAKRIKIDERSIVDMSIDILLKNG
jgi:hypothetical protein